MGILQLIACVLALGGLAHAIDYVIKNTPGWPLILAFALTLALGAAQVRRRLL